jgi:hypothetical protein
MRGSAPHNVYGTTLVDLLGAATTASSATGILQAARLRSIEVWQVSQADGGNTAYVGIDFPNPSSGGGAIGSPTTYVEDVSMSNSQPAHLCVAPPALSTASMWQNANNNQIIMTLFSSDDTVAVVDVVVDCVLADGGATGTRSGSGLSAGKVYLSYLDYPGSSIIPWDYTPY